MDIRNVVIHSVEGVRILEADGVKLTDLHLDIEKGLAFDFLRVSAASLNHIQNQSLEKPWYRFAGKDSLGNRLDLRGIEADEGEILNKESGVEVSIVR